MTTEFPATSGFWQNWSDDTNGTTELDPMDDLWGNESDRATEQTIPDLTSSLWSLLVIPVILWTMLSNALVFLAILREKKLQNPTNHLLQSLAIADFMVACVVMPLALLPNFYGYWPLGAIMCNLWILLDVMFCGASIFHLLVISVDRYIAITKPFMFNTFRRSKWLLLIKITFSWIGSFAVAIPQFVLGLVDDENIFMGEVCMLNNRIFMGISSIITFFVPLTIMMVCHGLTTRELKRKMSMYKQQQKQQQGRQHLESVDSENELTTKTALDVDCESEDDAIRGDSSINQVEEDLTPEDGEDDCSICNIHSQAAKSEIKDATVTSNQTAPTETSAEVTCQSHDHMPPSNTNSDQIDREMTSCVEVTESADCVMRLAHDELPTNEENSLTDEIVIANEIIPITISQKNTYQQQDQESINNTHEAGGCHGDSNEQVNIKMDMADDPDVDSTHECTERPCSNCAADTAITQATSNTGNAEDTQLDHGDSDSITDPDQITITENPADVTKIPQILTKRGSASGESNCSNPGDISDVTSQRTDQPQHLDVNANAGNHGNNSLKAQESRTPQLTPITKHKFNNWKKMSRDSRKSSKVFFGSTDQLSKNSSLSYKGTRHRSVNKLLPSHLLSKMRGTQNEQRAARVLTFVLLTFLVCWTPFFVQNVLRSVCTTCNIEIVNNPTYDICVWLGYASSGLNPIIYTTFNKQFRITFRRLLTCKC
ncbi:D(2) dopamine receptor A-like [Ptychodera flava]|uniref:D(2) dopamine receptor A-like n=1 Tax=Ptychodera flava TaxID=63121 RepID=UPI00396A8EA5